VAVIRELNIAALILAISYAPTATAADLTNQPLWGCTVLLCLANPAGPMATPLCVAPIQKLFNWIGAFRPFPTCAMSGSVGNGTWAELGNNYYDRCPAGSTALAAGTPVYESFGGSLIERFAIGEGESHNPYNDPEGKFRKICVDGSGQQTVLQPTTASPRLIDVFIDDAFHNRVRW
jgi:hypothetical protein